MLSVSNFFNVAYSLYEMMILVDELVLSVIATYWFFVSTTKDTWFGLTDKIKLIETWAHNDVYFLKEWLNV